jgi:sigma-E factor negative regulatory protein RseB
MRRASVRLFPGVVLLHLCVSAALAQNLPESEAIKWLQRIADAARQLNYSGTFVYQHGEHVETCRITHFFDKTGEYEKLETLDGPLREIIRNNDEILTFDVEQHIIKHERRMRRNTFPALLPEQLAHLTDYYWVRKVDQDRVAGFDAQALVLKPRDALRYGHKLWADTASGLLLKARMVDEAGHIVEQSAFTQLTIGNSVTREATRPRFDPQDPQWQHEYPPRDPTVYGDTGWTVSNQPAGFRKVVEMKRVKAGSQASFAHLVYSDGLAAVSIFIEPLPAGKVKEGAMRQGAVNIYVRPLSEQLVTVLGEAPAETVMQMANSVIPRGQ